MTDQERARLKSMASSARNHAKFCNDAIINLVKRIESGKHPDAATMAREAGETVTTLISALHTIRNLEQAAIYAANRERHEAEEAAEKLREVEATLASAEAKRK